MDKYIKMVYVDDADIETIKFEKAVKEFKEIKLLACFTDAESAIEFCSINKPDLALVDIVLPGNSGIWLAEKLKEIDIPFALISSHPNYAFDAFKIAALHYIPRPITSLAIRELIERFKKAKNQKGTTIEPAGDQLAGLYPKRIYVNTQKQILILQLEHVVYIEAEGSYTNFHLIDGKVIVSGKNLKKYSDQIELNPDFVKIHRSYIINQSHLQSINKKKLEMTFLFKNKKEIKLATFRRSEWMDKFL